MTLRCGYIEFIGKTGKPHGCYGRCLIHHWRGPDRKLREDAERDIEEHRDLARSQDALATTKEKS